MGHIPQEHYEPNSAIERWVDSRMPIIRFAADFAKFPTPKNLNWWYIFGIALSFCLAVQIVTGIVLAMHYTPSIEGAFASVEHIMRDVNGGWLLRYVHANGASMFFIAVYIHIFRGLYYGSYKAPRELLWIIGCVIYLVMMGTAFMGYVLPWGQMSLHGASVITNLFGAIPLVGTDIKEWLLGGQTVSGATLNRFFSLHYLLPFVIAGLVVLHIWALHVVGNNNPTGVEMRKDSLANVKKDAVPFHPYFTVKDLVGLMIFVGVFAFFVFFAPNELGHPDNYIEGNPLKTPAHIVPEWYFLPFYAILRSIDDKLMGVLAMFGSIAVLFFVPWLDTSRTKSARYRPQYKWWFWVLVADFLLLMWLGKEQPDGAFLGLGDGGFVTNKLVSGVATLYWFAHFLVVMPIVGLTETPKTPPESIEADFYAKKSAAE